jgi:hypothetical protein
VYIWAGIGLVALVDMIGHKLTRNKRSSIVAIIAITYAIIHCWMHFDAYDHAENKSFEVNGMTMLEAFPKDSIVLCKSNPHCSVLSSRCTALTRRCV